MRCVHVGGQPYDDGTPPKIEDARVAKLRLLQQLQVQVQTLNRLKSLQEQKRLARSKEVSYLPQKNARSYRSYQQIIHVRVHVAIHILIVYEISLSTSVHAP